MMYFAEDFIDEESIAKDNEQSLRIEKDVDDYRLYRLRVSNLFKTIKHILIRLVVKMN